MRLIGRLVQVILLILVSSPVGLAQTSAPRPASRRPRACAG